MADTLSESTQQVLTEAIEELSRPFTTTHDVKGVSMKLDAIAAKLLKSSYVAAKFGSDKVGQLAAISPELAALLREIGDDFAKAAAPVSNLMAWSRSSLVDFGTSDDDVTDADAAREQLRDALITLQASIPR